MKFWNKIAQGASYFVKNGVSKVLWNQGRLLQRLGKNFLQKFRLISWFWRMPCANLWIELPNWSRRSMSWRPGLIAIPAIPRSLHLKTRLRLRKTKGKKAYAIPVANLDIRATIGNWRRLRKWLRSWSIGRKPVLSVGGCWLRVREDHFRPWNDIRSGSCQKFSLLLPSTDWWPVGVPTAGSG